MFFLFSFCPVPRLVYIPINLELQCHMSVSVFVSVCMLLRLPVYVPYDNCSVIFRFASSLITVETYTTTVNVANIG